MTEFLLEKISIFFTFNQGSVFEVLLILMAVIWVSGNIFRRFKFPLMVGELLAGILIGPAVLGLMEQTETIKILAELGVFFMLLHAGLESNSDKIINATKATVLIALFSLLGSFGAGYSIGLFLGLSFEASLFLGIGISFSSIAIVHNTIKSLKITERKLGKTLAGTMLINDMLAFILFSVVMSVISEGEFKIIEIFFVTAKVVLFFSSSIFLGHKILPKFSKIFNTEGNKGFTFTLVIALFFGLLAEKIGLHVIIGAYLAGIFIRQNLGEGKLYNKIEDRIFALSYSFLGPIFFASIGLYISFDILFSSQFLFFLLIFITAITSKFFIGGGIALLSKKFTLKESVSIGIGLIARGEMVLIVAKIGFDKMIINEIIFSSLVLTVFFTAIITPLSLRLLIGHKGCKLKN